MLAAYFYNILLCKFSKLLKSWRSCTVGIQTPPAEASTQHLLYFFLLSMCSLFIREFILFLMHYKVTCSIKTLSTHVLHHAHHQLGFSTSLRWKLLFGEIQILQANAWRTWQMHAGLTKSLSSYIIFLSFKKAPLCSFPASRSPHSPRDNHSFLDFVIIDNFPCSGTS